MRSTPVDFDTGTNHCLSVPLVSSTVEYSDTHGIVGKLVIDYIIAYFAKKVKSYLWNNNL